MKTQRPDDSVKVWHMVFLSLFGVGVALICGVIMVGLFPALLPDEPDSSVRQFAGQSLEVAFYASDGDLFSWLPGKVRPPEENTLLGRYTIAWDDDGFRVPVLTAEAYPIAAFGDSFTEGANVPTPWPDVLAAELNVPVQNLGYRAYGAHDHVQVAQSHLDQYERDWVLYAHFGGNDFHQAEQSPEQGAKDRALIESIPYLTRRAWDNVQQNFIASEAQYDYPMPVVIGGAYYEIALLDMFMWWQIAPQEGFEATRAYTVLGDTLDTITNHTNDETCRAFIFIPPKGILYFPFLGSAQNDLLAIAQRPVIRPDGTTQLQPHPYDISELEAVLESFNDQRDAMAQLADEKGWLFIDLLEPMAQAAAQGELLYYRYDSHWNQTGHDLAGQVIGDFMREANDCTPNL